VAGLNWFMGVPYFESILNTINVCKFYMV
jgi:hypothetical protein